MKECFKCHQVKPLSEFYRHPRMADGHLNKCKACTRVDVMINRARKDNYYRAYDRERNALPHRRRDRARRTRRYREKHPEREAAYRAVALALSEGEIEKPACCQGCGGSSDLHAHHEDYTRPLKVVWLCARCHAHHHRVRSFFGEERSTMLNEAGPLAHGR